MNKYLVISIFIAAFFYLLKKDRVYIVPMALLIFSNLNGLLDWEDFALKGVVKFQDYGLVITLLIIFSSAISKDRTYFIYERAVKNSYLYKLILGYWVYYFFEFIYSILIQGDLEWPIKMGRTFFYGLVIFLIFKQLKPNPVALFEKVITILKFITLLLGTFYVFYNLGGFDIYPKGEHEEFVINGLQNVKRNFSGLPTFTYYFIILFSDLLVRGRQSTLINLGGLLLLVACVFFSLTRGMLLLTIAIIVLTVFLSRPNAKMILRIASFTGVLLLLVPLFPLIASSHFEAMTMRFEEFGESGLTQSGNFVVRSMEFSRIIGNVLDFNPLFGFGFTNIEMLKLGYQSNVLFGGSPDNGYSNLIGTTGFIGLGLFLVLMAFWIRTNLKLQALKMEPYSKVNFIYIIFMLIAFLDGASFSYMHSYALFIAYDLLAYAYLTKTSLSKRHLALSSGKLFSRKLSHRYDR